MLNSPRAEEGGFTNTVMVVINPASSCILSAEEGGGGKEAGQISDFSMDYFFLRPFPLGKRGASSQAIQVPADQPRPQYSRIGGRVATLTRRAGLRAVRGFVYDGGFSAGVVHGGGE